MSNVYFIIGMAGSGKTTLVKTLTQKIQNAFVINIDPAVYDLPYIPDIDIRDTIDYNQLISENKLGPNGAILTALNLFVSKIDQLIQLLPQDRPILIDSPGQIESFIWSASGEILLKVFPESVQLYVVDAARCINPSIFVSSMIYLLSIQHRLQLDKMIVVMNKIDILCENELMQEMKQIYQEYQEKEQVQNPTQLDMVQLYVEDSLSLNAAFQLQSENDYQSSFLSSINLSLDQFWLKNVFKFISCQTNANIQQLVSKIIEMGDDQRKKIDKIKLQINTRKEEKYNTEKKKFDQQYDKEENMDDID